MERFLRQESLDATPNSPTASKEWRHWFWAFNTFLTSISALEPYKLAPMNAAAVTSPEKINSDDSSFLAATQQPKCYFCGGVRHNRPQCPARDSTCHKCNKKGHFAKICRSFRYSPATSSSTCAVLHSPTLAAVSATSPGCLARSTIYVLVNDVTATVLVDTGSSKSFVSNRYIQQKSLKCHAGSGHLSMGSSSLLSPVLGHCTVDITLKGKVYPDIQLTVLPDLCSDVILGQDFMSLHSGVTIDFARGSSMPTWLYFHEPVLLRRHVRNSKYDPLVDEVEFLGANPQYAHVRFPGGRQSTGSLRDLAPAGQAVPDTADPELTELGLCYH
ncbi:Gag-Pol polyprotein-like 3, partial [Homarus americanus]